MSDLDHLDIGRMIGRIDHLSDLLQRAERRMETTDAQMATLSARLGEVEDRYKVGKAAVFGAIMVLAAAIYGIKDVFSRIVGTFTP